LIPSGSIFACIFHLINPELRVIEILWKVCQHYEGFVKRNIYISPQPINGHRTASDISKYKRALVL
jgi:hypothetical protein